MQTGLDLNLLRKKEIQKQRILALCTFFVFLLLWGVSLCIRTSTVALLSPAEAYGNLFNWLKLNFCQLFELPGYLDAQQYINNSDTYFESLARLKISVMTFCAGAMLSVAGAVYQSVFRNPMASPTVLGVSTGVDLGLLIVVLIYGAETYARTAERYQWCYLLALAMLVIVLTAGKLISGKGKDISVTNMLLVGMVISNLFGVINNYYTMEMEAETLVIMQELSGGIYINTDGISFLYLGIMLLVGLIPIFLMRFSFNATCFPNEESYTLGVNPMIVSIVSLLAATVLVTAAMVHCGSVGMVSLVIPHFCRYIFGADFRKLFVYGAIYGGLFLLLCRDISASISFGLYGALPIGTVVTFISAPLFVVVLLSNRRGWE